MRGKKAIAIFMAVMMLMSVCLWNPGGQAQTAEAAGTKLHNPKRSNGTVTYDCVYFGSYPQAEVVTAAMLKRYESYRGVQFWDDDNFIVDETLYQTLKKAKGWDTNGDITLPSGDRYHRIKRSDTTYQWTSYFTNWYADEYDNSYHYYKYQPIKWRVLSVNKNEALLLSDRGLDCQEYYNEDLMYDPDSLGDDRSWETSTIRSWLNGYRRKAGKVVVDYTKKNFIDSAFTSKEQSAIKERKIKNKEWIRNKTAEYLTNRISEGYFASRKSTTDKIFLLSYDNATNTKYGFSSYDDRADKAKQIKPSAYAMGMGAYYNSTAPSANTGWTLRTIHFDGTYMICVDPDGSMSFRGVNFECNEADPEGTLVVPALYLNLSSSNVWSYAGTVSVEESKNGLVKENGKYYYYKNNKKQTKYTGLIKNADKTWCYVKNGVWQSKYTGMVKQPSGKWYYVEKGRKKYTTGIVKHTDGKWWYVKNGEWQPKYTGMVKQSSGKWYYVVNGKRKSVTRLVKHKDGSWWYVKNGVWQSKYTGIVKQPSGRSFYVEKGKKKYITGYVTVKGKRYKLKKGEVI